MWAKSDWHLPDTCKCVQAPGGPAVKPSDNVHLPGLRRKWPSAREEAEDLESTGRKPNRPALMEPRRTLQPECRVPAPTGPLAPPGPGTSAASGRAPPWEPCAQGRQQLPTLSETSDVDGKRGLWPARPGRCVCTREDVAALHTKGFSAVGDTEGGRC